MAIKTSPTPAGVSTRLPLDLPPRLAVVQYARRALLIVSGAVLFLACGATYLGYRAAVGHLPWEVQLVPLIVVGVGIYTRLRWVNHRDVPTALDQIAGALLLVALLPAVVQVHLYPKLFPKRYRALRLVGKKGRLIHAVELRTRDPKGPIEGAMRPSLIAIISMLPALAMGRVRFRGRPLIRLRNFGTTGPLSLREFGRAPGIIPGYTRHSEGHTDFFAGNLFTIWGQIASRDVLPDRHSVVVLALATATLTLRKEETPTESRGGVATKTTPKRARVLVTFVVAPAGEAELRARVRRDMGTSDVLVARGDRLGSLLAAAWDSWGPGHEAPPAQKKAQPNEPSAPQMATYMRRLRRF